MPRYTRPMATILATWELGQRYGHLAHLAPAARALSNLGHRTVLAGRDPATAARLPDAPFASVLQAPLHVASGPPTPTLTYPAVIADGGFADVTAAVPLVRAWLKIFESEAPAAILSEHAPMSLLAAHIAGIPAARLGIGFTAPPAARPFVSLLPWVAASEADRAAADATADAVVRRLCQAFGAPVVDGVAGLLEGAPAYLTTWPELDIYGARPGICYYGTVGGFGGTARPAWPTGQGRRAFVYLPFDHPLANALATAIVRLEWRAIWHGGSQTPQGLPPGIVASPDPVDMTAVLADADVQVGRGGHASLCDGLRAGVPTLMMPDTLEALLLAGRAERQGLGLRVEEGIGAAGLAGALARLAEDPAIAASVTAFSTRYRAYNPRGAAAELARDLIAGWGL